MWILLLDKCVVRHTWCVVESEVAYIHIEVKISSFTLTNLYFRGDVAESFIETSWKGCYISYIWKEMFFKE